MAQTIEELYFETLPTDLYRHGTTASPQLNKPRMMPPRQADQIHDVKIYVRTASSTRTRHPVASRRSTCPIRNSAIDGGSCRGVQGFHQT